LAPAREVHLDARLLLALEQQPEAVITLLREPFTVDPGRAEFYLRTAGTYLQPDPAVRLVDQ